MGNRSRLERVIVVVVMVVVGWVGVIGQCPPQHAMNSFNNTSVASLTTNDRPPNHFSIACWVWVGHGASRFKLMLVGACFDSRLMLHSRVEGRGQQQALTLSLTDAMISFFPSCIYM